MLNNPQITKEDFGTLLKWFSSDEKIAAEKYEEIRDGLIRYFHFKGCSDPINLTDETFNRVTNKINSLDLSKDVKKITIFYGFAYNIYREYLRDLERNEIELIPDIVFQEGSNEITELNEENNLLECLENCLNELDENDKKIVIKYYNKEKKEKIELRKELAEQLELTANALHVKVHRLKASLKKCINKCLNEKNV